MYLFEVLTHQRIGQTLQSSHPRSTAIQTKKTPFFSTSFDLNPLLVTTFFFLSLQQRLKKFN